RLRPRPRSEPRWETVRMLRKLWRQALGSGRRFRGPRPARPKLWQGRALLTLEPLAERIAPAVTASFLPGPHVLSVFGDLLSNTITISRDAAGKILVNGGAVPVLGGTPTVANTSVIQVFGLGGNDQITLNEANGALPQALLFG